MMPRWTMYLFAVLLELAGIGLFAFAVWMELRNDGGSFVRWAQIVFVLVYVWMLLYILNYAVQRIRYVFGIANAGRK